MKRIMIITNSLTGGGAERSMNLVANELTARGLSVALVPINAGSADQVIPKCEVYPLERPWRGSLSSTISSLWNFNRLVWAWKPDLIVLNCDLPELFGATVFRNAKLIAVEHSSVPWTNHPPLGRFVRTLLHMRKVTWVKVSQHLKIWANSSTTAVLIRNPLAPLKPFRLNDLEKFPLRLIFIGRLSAEKRPDWVVDIAHKLNLKCEIIGDGPLLNELKLRAERDATSVTFHGHLTNPWEIIRPGDLLIAPSTFEGDGLVILEGMQRGVPMLLSDIHDFRRFELNDSNYCLTVEDFAQRIDAFSTQIQKLIPDAETILKLLSEREISRVVDDWEKVLLSQ